MIVQEPDKLRDSQAYVWPCHKVLISENPIIKAEGERESLTQTLPSLLLSFQVRLPVLCACIHKQVQKQGKKARSEGGLGVEDGAGKGGGRYTSGARSSRPFG